MTNNLVLKPILSEAWSKVKGVKRYFLGAILLLLLFQAMMFPLEVGTTADKTWLSLLWHCVFLFLTTPLLTGLIMLGVKQARGTSIYWPDIFQYFPKIIPLFLTQLLVFISSAIVSIAVVVVATALLAVLHDQSHVVFLFGVVLICALGLLIFGSLQVIFAFTLIVVADQGLKPWAAYKHSIGLVLPHFKIVFLAELFCLFLHLLALLTFGIALIWTLPFAFIVTGVLYRDICAHA